MHPANERWRYTVTLSLTGWAYTQNDPKSFCVCTQSMRDGVTLWRYLSLAGCIHKMIWDHSVYAPSQWEMKLHCNAISYWLGACTELSLHNMVDYWHNLRQSDVCWSSERCPKCDSWATVRGHSSSSPLEDVRDSLHTVSPINIHKIWFYFVMHDYGMY